MSLLNELEDTLQSAVARHGPAVVGVGRGWGRGSGVVIAPGRVLASAHAIRGDDVIATFADGGRREGRVLGSDPDLDVTVVEVDTGDTEPLAWSDREPSPGQAVVALANPGGHGLRVSLGFISSVGRSFRGPRGRRIAGAIEHTAALPRGSSGGPLLDPAGGLLGLNAVRADGGLILALHGDAGIRDRVAALSRGEAPQRPRLGVALAPPRAARELRRAVGLPEREGLLVRAVQDGTPAAAAGLRRGDLIVRAGERETSRIDALHDAIEAAVPGEQLELGIVRGNDELALPVALGEAAG
jgi:S1-C subfamily serine protease